MGNGDGDRETELQRWLLARYPGGGAVADRVRRAQWRAIVSSFVVFVAVQVLLRRFDGARLWSLDGPGPAWAVTAWVTAGLLILAGLGLGLRPAARQVEGSAALRALTLPQRRELARQIRGHRPRTPGDEPALRRVAFAWVVRRTSALPAIGAVIALLPSAVAGPGGAVGLVRLALMLALATTAVHVVRRAAAGARYLDDDLSAPADDEEEASASR